ncbi:MAG: 5-(carboxyamino)imidazole ribonucleotide synthase [Kiloniellales bacterium]|nr:5-(carboxyamino)imidazole ribonucleotide synthase [Kiloniellales bacterium]
MSLTLSRQLPPGSTIGILGGGQLGRMAAMAAQQLGYYCHIYCPEALAPACQATAFSTEAAYDNEDALVHFAGLSDVITFEFENIPFDTVHFLAERTPVNPSPKVLEICQNRLREKDFCNAFGVPTSRYQEVRSAEELDRVIRDFPGSSVLKTTEMGYDGKGQVTLTQTSDSQDAWARISGNSEDIVGILEGFVDFQCEISVIVARSLHGAIETYVPVENQHRNHILYKTIAPARVSPAVIERAEAIARHLAENIELVGLLAIEMFVTREEEILVNELAPRPHNSGHWTMDACVTSQFEQFIRAVSGAPLGSVYRHSDAVMTNLIGDDVERWSEILKEPATKLHLYGKMEARPGRKMGHMTRIMPRA